MNKKDKICSPSLQVERSTGAFNNVIWGFIWLLSLIMLTFITLPIKHFMQEIFKLPPTFISQNFRLLILIFAILTLIFFYQIGEFLHMLLHAYMISDHKIIKGRITNSALMAKEYVLKSASNANAPINLPPKRLLAIIFPTYYLILENLNLRFVQNYFTSNIYHKKEYLNPRLINETKTSLIYQCDNQQKLVIPKIYTDMGNNEEIYSSFLNRICEKVFIIFLLITTIILIDLLIGTSNFYL